MTIQSLLTLINPDLVNGLFEFGGAASIGYNAFRVWKDKLIKGVSIVSTSFFTSWGLWNLYYYPHLDQTLSFAGGVAIVLTNVIWLGLMIRYRNATVPTPIESTTPALPTFDAVCELLDKQAGVNTEIDNPS